jgi:chromate transporter
MVGCSVLAVKFSSICCILFCGAAGVLAYGAEQMKKKGCTK